ncbi:MAG: DUF951 domain-containing protein [Ruminococcus sp.]|nr:DUF951 domain-containing protein [Ruminococcus sp.]
MDIRTGDEIEMKKPHPCGNNRFAVLRVGMDFKIRCTACSREVMLPRKKAEKSIRAVYRDGDRLPLVKGAVSKAD